MKALLVNPSISLHKEDVYRGKRTYRDVYPFGLYSISAYLESNGIRAPIVDLELEEPDWADTIRREKPDVVGITATTASRFEAINIAKSVKAASREPLVVVGGPHFTFTPDDTLTHVPEIDIVVRGEGEGPMLDLMHALDAGSSKESIAGLSFVNDGTVIHTPDREPMRNLGELPTIDWESICVKYDYHFLGMSTIAVHTSRGCPINCSFCSTTKMWGRHPRWKDPIKVVDEIEYLLNRKDFAAVFFVDDTLTLSRRHVTRICAEIERRRLKFRWVCQSRADVLNPTVLDAMKRAGCYYLYLGVESGSQRMLDTIGKRITREQVVQAVSDCKAAGILCHPLFMYSLPDETDEDRRQTIELLDELVEDGIDLFTVNPTIIYPGTDVEERAKVLGILPPDFSWSEPFYEPKNEIIQRELGNTPLYTENMSMDEILAKQEMLQAIRRPLHASLRAKRFNPIKSFFNLLKSLGRVRSWHDLNELLGHARERFAVLALSVRARISPQR